MTQEEMDEKEFWQYLKKEWYGDMLSNVEKEQMRQSFLAGRRTLREKSKNQLVLPDGCLPREKEGKMNYTCPKCKRDNVEEFVEEVDIGVGTQVYKDLFCHNCGWNLASEINSLFKKKENKDG